MQLEIPFLNRSKGNGQPALGDTGGLLTQDAGGKWTQATREGRTFHGGSDAAGSVLPIYSATAQVFGLWNPYGSGVNAIVTQVALTYVSTTGAAGGFVLGVTRNAAGIGTGAPIVAFTDGVLHTTIHNGLVGSGVAPRCRFTPSAATTIAAPALYRHLGINQLVITAADATSTQWRAVADFDGDIVMQPGSALWVCGNISTLIIMAPGITWVEEAE